MPTPKIAHVAPSDHLIRLLGVIKTIPEHELPLALDCIDHVLAQGPGGAALPEFPRRVHRGRARYSMRLMAAFAGMTTREAIGVMNELKDHVHGRIRAMGCNGTTPAT